MNSETSTTEIRIPECFKFIPFDANSDDSSNHKERELPEWCKCMPWDWDDVDTVPPACHSFNDNGKGVCRNCEHGEDCHTESKNELARLKKENQKLMADIIKLSSQSSINNLIPEVIYQMMTRHAAEYRETMTSKGV
jgi:hypothetical protein